jgi:hypothetical protein
MSHNGNTMIEEMYYDLALDEVDNTLSEEEQEIWITKWVKEQLENHPDDYFSLYELERKVYDR